AFDTAGTVGAPADVAALVPDDLIVGHRPAAGRGAETVAHFHALDRLDAHQGPGQARIESPVGLHIGAHTGGKPVGEYLHYPAQSVARLLGVVDLGDHPLGGGGVETPHGVLVQSGTILRSGSCGVLGNADA